MKMKTIIDEMPRDGFLYLATPYSKYPAGRGAAYNESRQLAAKLRMNTRRRIWSPIATFHLMHVQTGVAFDDPVWQEMDDRFLHLATGFIVGMLDTWRVSRGMAHEMAIAKERKLPIYYLKPGSRYDALSLEAAPEKEATE